MDLYEFVRGPVAWAAILFFLAGCVFRMIIVLKKGHQKRMIYPLVSLRDGFLSILHGTIPFGSAYMRKHPALTVVAFIFHVCLLFVPLFLLAHSVVWYESWGILGWSIPDMVADVMTVCVVLACLFFVVRRLTVPEVKKLTRPGDFLLLAVIVLPFLTGFLATHQVGPYRLMLILHVLAGEFFLVMIPFSRLSHMFLFWFSRAYMGAEFGKVLKPRDW
ncbi:MAG: TmcC family electron transfer complex membrane anchor subunit [Thermodesulfobacteriota bacterium]